MFFKKKKILKINYVFSFGVYSFYLFPFRGIFYLLFRLVSRTHHAGPSVSTWSLVARCCTGFKSSLSASPFFSPESVCDLSSSEVRDSDSQALFFPGVKSLGIWSGIITSCWAGHLPAPACLYTISEPLGVLLKAQDI